MVKRSAIALVTAGLMTASAASAATAQSEADGEAMDAADSTTIWRSSTTKGPNGLYVGPDGNVYAASVPGDEITVHDPESGEILDRIGPERGVRGPDDVVIAPDGTVYWTEILGGNVGMLRPDGTFVTQQVGPGVNPITLSDDGRLFVARVFFGDGLYELDPELQDPPVAVNEAIVGLNGMDFGPDGLLYAPLFFGGAVARLDVDAEMPEPEVVAEGFAVPAAVAFDSSGDLHVADLAQGTIVKVDLETAEQTVLGSVPATLDNLAFDADDRLFTTSSPEGQLYRLDGGELVGLNESGFTGPAGVAISPDGTLWVGELFALRGFQGDGEPVISYYDRSTPPGAAVAPGPTVSADGDQLIVSSSFTNSVQVIDPASGEVFEDIRTLAAPANAIRHGERLVAAQAAGANVVDANSGDVLIGDLALPVGLASDGETLYVSDWALGTVHAVPSDGDPVLLAEGLTNPEGLALDGDRLLVVEEGLDQVSAIDLASGEVVPAITGLDLGISVIPGSAPFGYLNGITVGPDGTIYVTADGSRSVHAFAP